MSVWKVFFSGGRERKGGLVVLGAEEDVIVSLGTKSFCGTARVDLKRDVLFG